jgi:hypothetical protein
VVNSKDAKGDDRNLFQGIPAFIKNTEKNHENFSHDTR